WNDNGELIRISSPRQTRSYSYSDSGRLTGVHTTTSNLDIRIPYATDPAGNRLPDPELHPDSTLTVWPDNRIAEDAHYVYRHDEYGRLAEKTDRIPEGVIRMHDERTHHYHYDSQHRLVFYTRIQHGEPLVESRYLYDPLGRRMAKRVWRRERDLTGWMSLSRKPEVTWYGWDGDRLATVQTDTTRIQTVYEPGSFTPLIRIETDVTELEKAQRRSLAEKLQQEGSEDGHGVVFPAELVRLLDRLEEEIRADRVSSESRAWLAQCGLTVEKLARQVEPEYTPARSQYLYHCDHRGLPLALISEDGNTAWSAKYDEWGNQLYEDNPHHLYQPYRLPGQQYDEELGLCYNRNRYYDPLLGRYITQDPIGLKGGWNLYAYPLNPVQRIDPMGLNGWNSLGDGGIKEVCQQVNSTVRYLPPDEAAKVIHNVETMHNVYNPLSEYVFGWSVAPALVAGGVLGGEVSLAERGAACITNVADAVIVKGERDEKKLAFVCVKGVADAGLSGFPKKMYDFVFDNLVSYTQKQ
ncbi:RHS repeat-associated core domain-containing protein, partial [Escherichia coli]|uniref:RHS repeat-associated core domain-containing protein n=1 Tax=Escherichia coli TaxID=562 RepID=UPI00202CE259